MELSIIDHLLQIEFSLKERLCGLLMNEQLQTEKDKLQISTNMEINQETEKEEVLCPHCLRTATNGIKCKGICVADNDY